ncbi:MAG: hypothetical protein LBD48_07875 [Treponema sp.]|nr:hypothetical protein [Treponema sp.]
MFFSIPLFAQDATTWPILLGTDTGLFGYAPSGKTAALWSGGQVRKILSAGSGGREMWVLLGSEGVLVSADLQNWERRNQGLPVKTIKIVKDGEKSFLPMVQEIKDLEINPADPDIMVCASKDRAYLSRNQGRSWTSLGAPPYRTSGIKAVSAAFMPETADGTAAGSEALTVFLSHSTYGVFYIQPDRGTQWIELNNGLEKLETTGNADEVSDIAVVINPGASGAIAASPEIYAAQTFRRRIYRLDWSSKTFSLIWPDNSPFGTVDSLDAGKTSLRFLYEGTVASIDFAGYKLRKRQDLLEQIRAVPARLRPNCAVIRETKGRRESERIHLSELWLLDEKDSYSADGSGFVMRNDAKPAPAKQAFGREGLYLPVNHAMDPRSLKPYLDTISSRGLDMIVIDMKDDYGRLRFTPDNPAISEKGRVFRPLDIDALLHTFKSRGIYTVARIVVFKDPVLAAKENNRYAVWDAKNNKPWAGFYDSRRKKTDISEADRQNEHLEFFESNDSEYEIVRTFYDERWVDPYSEAVWEYIAATAVELHQRGFDEIQFDYIRFPTDGANIADARYRWQENGMDMESAILSFLRHIRSRVSAPISIDIYGANGWYRTGARTGQEVELIAPWVDVICPMYYPSHFEQDFLAQNPAELRPYRIYFQGTLRTARIGRGQIIVRPYVQAFYLNVAYDRKYYNLDYVRREVEGIHAAGKPGLTYWNNSGRYDDIPSF